MLDGDHAADEAGHETGPVGHAVGDVSGEDRDEEAEGDAADLEQQGAPAVDLRSSTKCFMTDGRLVDL